MALYRIENADAVKARSVLDYEKHKDGYKRRASDRYVQRRDEIKQLTAEYQRTNKEKKSEWNAKYNAANKHKSRANTAKRKSRKLLATPLWADDSVIREIYRKAERMTLETGVIYHVDHIVPIRSPLVCGLHWEGNMQIITATENMSKCNRYWPDMP